MEDATWIFKPALGCICIPSIPIGSKLIARRTLHRRYTTLDEHFTALHCLRKTWGISNQRSAKWLQTQGSYTALTAFFWSEYIFSYLWLPYWRWCSDYWYRRTFELNSIVHTCITHSIYFNNGRESRMENKTWIAYGKIHPSLMGWLAWHWFIWWPYDSLEDRLSLLFRRANLGELHFFWYRRGSHSRVLASMLRHIQRNKDCSCLRGCGSREEHCVYHSTRFD